MASESQQPFCQEWASIILAPWRIFLVSSPIKSRANAMGSSCDGENIFSAKIAGNAASQRGILSELVPLGLVSPISFGNHVNNF